MSDKKESSVLFSLQELRDIEQSRIREQEEAAKQAEEDRVRAQMDAARRKEEEERARIQAAEDAERAASPEVAEVGPAAAGVEQDPGDQEAGQREEEIDAHPPRRRRDARPFEKAEAARELAGGRRGNPIEIVSGESSGPTCR